MHSILNLMQGNEFLELFKDSTGKQLVQDHDCVLIEEEFLYKLDFLETELIPSIEEFKQLKNILKKPTIYQLSQKEKDLVLQFKDYVCTKPNSLTKIIPALDFNAQNIISLLNNCLERGKIDLDGALYFLGRDFSLNESLSSG